MPGASITAGPALVIGGTPSTLDNVSGSSLTLEGGVSGIPAILVPFPPYAIPSPVFFTYTASVSYSPSTGTYAFSLQGGPTPIDLPYPTVSFRKTTGTVVIVWTWV